MKIVISWSGERSKKIAEVFREWLPLCLQYTKPWMSDSDIPKGRRWAQELAKQLEDANFGLVCLVPENVIAPWINFEAGALSKLDGSYLWTYLHGLSPTDITGPLEDFQHTQFSKEDIKKLVQAINSAAQEGRLNDAVFDKSFENWWWQLEEKLKQVPAISVTPESKRPTESIMEEILERVRNLPMQIEELGRKSFGQHAVPIPPPPRYSSPEYQLIFDRLATIAGIRQPSPGIAETAKDSSPALTTSKP